MSPRPPHIEPPRAKAIEDPLPLTLRFVFVLGAFILIGWFAMFFLLQARW
jgi:hypothetical protein